MEQGYGQMARYGMSGTSALMQSPEKAALPYATCLPVWPLKQAKEGSLLFDQAV